MDWLLNNGGCGCHLAPVIPGEPKAREGDPEPRFSCTKRGRFATLLLRWVPFPCADFVGSGRG
jgi:hypothetical protein